MKKTGDRTGTVKVTETPGAIVIERKDGSVVLMDPQTKKFMPKPGAKRRAKKIAKYSHQSVLYHFQKAFDQKDGYKYLVKMLQDRPDRFFDIWTRMILRSVPADTPKGVTPEQHGAGLLNALQTGRLAEQLSALVKAGQKALQEQEQQAVTTAQPSDTP